MPMTTVDMNLEEGHSQRERKRLSSRGPPLPGVHELSGMSQTKTSEAARVHRGQNKLLLVLALTGIGLMHVPITTISAAEMTPCIFHDECALGEFCGLATFDSYEGWLANASACQPCAKCLCHHDAVDGVQVLAPTIAGKWHNASDSGFFFNQAKKARYDSAHPTVPAHHVFNGTGPVGSSFVRYYLTLCDFPDAPGPREGMIEKLPVTQSDMVARLLLTYVDGLPLGTTRVVELFDHCPAGLSARFEPVQFVKTGYSSRIGLQTAFYSYESGVSSNPYGVLPSSGYYRKQSSLPGFVNIILNKPTPGLGFREFSGTYKGFFAFGTTRRSLEDIGGQEAMLCNITLAFDPGYGGLVPWDGHTWGCKLRIPSLATNAGLRTKDVSRTENGKIQPETIRSSSKPQAGLPVSGRTQSRNPLSTNQKHDLLNTTPQLNGHSRTLLEQAVCLPGSHVISETTDQGLIDLETAKDYLTANLLGCRDLGQPYCCDECSSGKYQNLNDKFMCLSCPHGFTTKEDGTSSLAGCCLLENGVGLYNNQLRTSFNEFGVSKETTQDKLRENETYSYSIHASYYFCQENMDTASSPGSCTSTTESISMIPNVTDEIEEFQNDLGAPGPLCGDVQFVVQPTSQRPLFVPGKGWTTRPLPVSSLFELDFNCANCFFDVGPQGFLEISIYAVSDQTILPPELKSQATSPPDISKPRDPAKGTFWSREWKGKPAHVLDFTLDKNFLITRFTGSDTPLTRHYEMHEDCKYTHTIHNYQTGTSYDTTMMYRPGEATCPDMEKLYLSPHSIVRKKLSDYSKSKASSLFACEYEDPVAEGQTPAFPWMGNVPPKCEGEYKSRISSVLDMTVNDYTLHRLEAGILRTASLESEPLILGFRVHARVTPAHAGFKIGYKYWEASQVCRAGSFSNTGSEPCSLCPAGKFAAADAHAGSCFDCPIGTFSETLGSIQCSLCPEGKSTTTGGTATNEDCKMFCKAGRFSHSGLEPCSLCPRNTTQSRVGAKYCDGCPAGLVTLGAGLGFTNKLQWTCYDPKSFNVVVEQVRGIGSRLVFQISWNLPSDFVNIRDIVAIFKGDPIASVRQLQWMYGSTATTACSVNWDDKECKQPGQSIVASGSTVFTIDSAGPGLYGVVYFSESLQVRVAFATYICSDTLCGPDAGGWEARTGLFVCDKGQYSTTGAAPCTNCPKGFISTEFASTQCEECKLGFYSSLGNKECLKCPAGTSTRKSGSVLDECESCESLGLIAYSDPSCVEYFRQKAAASTKANQTVMTTPAPIVDNADICGNGKLRDKEECDDGNVESGDGCSDGCKIEPYFICDRMDMDTADVCSPTCGNGRVEEDLGEACDDGNVNNGDGCSKVCFPETGWRCSGGLNQISQCETIPTCGATISERETGVVPRREWEKGEICDDGNQNSGDGCSSECTIEPNYICTNFSATEPDVCCASLSLCGNGKRDLCEACDDGNRMNLDGCTDKCRFEKMNKCRDGCSGSLCVTEDHCPESLIGDRPQEPNCRDCNDIGWNALHWLNVSAQVYDSAPKWFPPQLSFKVPESGSRVAGHSQGMFLVSFQQAQNHSFGILEILASKSLIGPDGIDHSFSAIYGWGGIPSQLSCSYCSGMKRLTWPSGTISELAGMLTKDIHCIFLIDGASGLQTSTQKPFRGVEITIHEVGFEDDKEFLSVGMVADSGYPTYEKRFDRESRMPVTLHMKPTVRIGFWGKSHLFNRTVTWDPPLSALRFKISYKTLLLDQGGEECCKRCEYDPDCMLTSACFVSATAMTMQDDYLETRSHAVSSGQMLATKSLSESAPGIREISHSTQKLSLAFDGIQGLRSEIPCAFAQNTRQIVTTIKRNQDDWQGADGAWDGFCFMSRSCSSEGGLKDDVCFYPEDYKSPANTCSVRIEISGHILREYRYDCQKTKGLKGFARGVISYIQSTPEAVGTPLQLRYRRLTVTWTKSTLLDRPVGIPVKGVLTFGVSSEYDSTTGFAMQIILGRVIESQAMEPLTKVNIALSKFSAQEGDCTHLDITGKGSVLSIDPLEIPMSAELTGNLQSFDAYRQCNESFRILQTLSERSSECKSLLDFFLYRDMETELTSTDEGVCTSSCLIIVQETLGKIAHKCSEKWKSQPITSKYSDLMFKKLFIAATSHFWSKVACQTNHEGKRCIRTVWDYSGLFETCSLFEHAPGLLPLSAPFIVNRTDASLNPFCPKKCFDALLKYAEKDGCCSGSVSQEGVMWAELIQHGGKRKDEIDLGETANPWTPLGNGSRAKRYFVDQDCETGDRIFPDCLAKSTIYCGFSWRKSCCNFPCQNQGSKVKGECYCSCPTGWTGSDCKVRSIHVRVRLVFPFEDKSSFHFQKQAWTEQALKTISSVIKGVEVQVEWDSMKAIDVGGRRAISSNMIELAVDRRRSIGSLEVVLRVLMEGDAQTAKRLWSVVNQGLAKGTLMNEISRQSKGAWKPQVQKGTSPPIALDLLGKEICDNLEIMCQMKSDTGVETSPIIANASKKSNEGNKSVSVDLILAFCCAAVLLICIISFSWYARNKKMPDIHLAERVEMMLPSAKTKQKLKNFQDHRIGSFVSKEIDKKDDRGSNTVAGVRFSNISLTQVEMILDDDAGGKRKPSKRNDEGLGMEKILVSVTSDLVFDDSLVATPSRAVPTRESTEGALANLHKKGLRMNMHDWDGYSDPASGLKWLKIGHSKPTNGRQLRNSRLAEALMQTNEFKNSRVFSQQEWDDFGIKDLAVGDFVESGGSYFKPAVREYKYTADNVQNGLSEVEYQRKMILQRLRNVKKKFKNGAKRAFRPPALESETFHEMDGLDVLETMTAACSGTQRMSFKLQEEGRKTGSPFRAARSYTSESIAQSESFGIEDSSSILGVPERLSTFSPSVQQVPSRFHARFDEDYSSRPREAPELAIRDIAWIMGTGAR